MALDSTVSGPDADSYVTLIEADAYIDARLNVTGWPTTDALKEKALKMATIRLDEEHFAGSKATLAQRLRWPRFGTSDRDGHTIDGDVIPRLLKEAQIELALALAGSDLLADSGLEGFEQVKIGPIDIKIRQIPQGLLPDVVKRRLSPLLTAGASSGQPTIVRG